MRLSIIVIVLAVSTACAASGQTLAERLLLTDTLANKPASEVLANPVLTPMRSRVSLARCGRIRPRVAWKSGGTASGREGKCGRVV